jgi:hypothetical protein
MGGGGQGPNNQLVNPQAYQGMGVPVGQDPTAMGFPSTMQQFMQPQLGTYNPQLEAMKRMYQGQQQIQPMNPYNPNPVQMQPVGQPRQTQPQNPQRGLGGLQIDKFKNRLGQR